ncbi:MAG: hypothetical protein GVY26_03710 [Bacteroidetes bacterium]|nr:hypothetical protein [Bacteroidota bacterium]
MKPCYVIPDRKRLGDVPGTVGVSRKLAGKKNVPPKGRGVTPLRSSDRYRSGVNPRVNRKMHCLP